MARDYIEKNVKRCEKHLPTHTHTHTSDTKKFMLGAKDSKWSQKSK